MVSKDISSKTLKCKIVNIYQGGQSESWLEIYSDGTIIQHTENDGWAFRRNGPEAKDVKITMEHVARLEKRHGKPLIKAVQETLASMAE